MKNIDIEQMEFKEVSNKDMYFSMIESLLFAAGEPLKLKDIASIIECNNDTVKKLLEEMISMYKSQDRGIKLIMLNDSYQLVTKKENSAYVQKLLRINSRQTLSQASLETMAIIAYKQPITRVEIDEIRGVKSDRAVNTLIEKKLITDCGRKEVPGRPILYSVTDEFLRCFGISETSQLPQLDELVNMFRETLTDQIEETKE